jgi:hypothetical protein
MNLIDRICKALEIGIYSNKWTPCKTPEWINTSRMLPTREGGEWIVKGKTFVYKVVEPGVGGNFSSSRCYRQIRHDLLSIPPKKEG